MKHLVALLLLYPTLAASQGWEWQNPTPQGNTLHDIHVFNESTAVAVGDVGTVIRTTDGGLSWEKPISGVSEGLTAVSFVNNNLGWAVGGAGRIIKTTDGGNTWVVQTSGTASSLFCVDFSDQNNGWAGGGWFLAGEVLKTSNGGETWTTVASGLDEPLFSSHFIDSLTGWMVGGRGLVLATTDGGGTWTSQTLDEYLYSVHFVDAANGWISGRHGTVLKTTDGGNLWSYHSSGTNFDLYSIFFDDESTGWIAAGPTGAILKTTDGGTSWTEQTRVEVLLHAVRFADGEDGWVVGSGGNIFRTSDGGGSWIQQTGSVSDNRIQSIFFIDQDTGWTAAWLGTVLKTTNGGSSWSVQRGETGDYLESIRFVDPINGWVCGNDGGDGLILRTTNGGSSWISSRSGGPDLSELFFVDRNTGWSVGDLGTVLKTTDGGITWVAQTSGTTDDLLSVSFIDAHTGWVVGGGVQGSVVLKTTNGGESWIPLSPPTLEELMSVYFATATDGWVAGIFGSILKTTDGGVTWAVRTGDCCVHEIYFSDPNHGYIASSGTVLRTSNAGTDWSVQPFFTTETMTSVFFVSANVGWVVGDGNGVILHTSTGGTGLDPPEPMTLVSPLDGSTVSTNPTLVWEASSGALWHTLQISYSPYFITYELNRTNITEAEYQLSALEEDTTYYWRVSVTDNTGTSGWSEVWSFRTSALPSEPLAQYGVCYGSTGNVEPNNPGALISIDHLTGAGTLIGPTGIIGDGGPSVRALAIKSTGEMYAMSHAESSDLYSVNASTGAGMFVANTGLLHPGDICFDAEDVLYGVDDTNILYIIDESTGVRTVVGATGVTLAGLAYDPTDGTMYGSGSADDIYTIDLGTGATTLVGTTGLGGNTPDIHFDQAGNLFGVKRGAGGVYDYIAIDKTTGAGTLIGSTGFVAVVGLATRLEPPSAIPCGDVANFQTRCRAGGTIQARLTLANTNYAGEIVEFSIDGSPYQVTVGSNGRANLSVGVFDLGLHTVEVTDPAGCVDPVTVRCRSGIATEGDDFWNDEESWEIPVTTSLIGNYPNPFNPSTTFRYALAEQGLVGLKVYNMLGQLVRTVVNEHQVEGYHEAIWDGRNEVGATVASGIYVYRMTAGNLVETKRMILMK